MSDAEMQGACALPQGSEARIGGPKPGSSPPAGNRVARGTFIMNGQNEDQAHNLGLTQCLIAVMAEDT